MVIFLFILYIYKFKLYFVYLKFKFYKMYVLEKRLWMNLHMDVSYYLFCQSPRSTLQLASYLLKIIFKNKNVNLKLK